jgi:2-keto-4-pentenoate hydratase/2-oxohepta-3-ene-1,7-dioic acid hydratase in catechol pathway
MKHVWGYTIANDVTGRDLQRRYGQWFKGKSLDRSCPLGPWIETDFVPGKQRIEAIVNGEVRQSSTLDKMIFDVPRIINFVSSVMTLLPGDVIITGTPSGIGPMPEGAEVSVSIDGLGTLTNKVSNRAK